MKIETEVEHSVYAFHHSVAEGKGGGCSVSGAEPSPIAQERSSIDRPEWQPPGCGGCGPSSAAAESDHNNGNISLTSVFDCEHFQFIDEDDEDGVSCDNVPATQTSAGEENAAPASNGPPRDAGLAEVNSQQQTHDDEMGDSESVARAKSHAVKRQVSFDDAAISSSSSRKRELKSLLKKANSVNKRQKNRVTFDEAVVLYSDEHEDVQMLALTTGPDIVYQEVFYMFEPPIEYQDVPPFEPPAEYRDIDEVNIPPQSSVPVDTQTDFASKNVVDSAQTEIVVQNEPRTPCVEPTVPNTTDEQNKEHPASDADLSDVAVSKETENTDSSTEEHTNPETGQQINESTLESDMLFERFLEAEREFAVDEELNSVFHALETNFGNDDKNGALDDNFFRKLISLLSSAEGETPDGTLVSDNYFVDPNFLKSQDFGRDTEDEDNSQAHSRTLSEADSDCSISSQDTIIVRFGEDDNEQTSGESTSLPLAKSEDTNNKYVPDDNSGSFQSEKCETSDEVFTEISESASSSDEKPQPLPRESLLIKNNHVSQAVAKLEKVNGESLSRQSSGEQSVNSGNSQDPPQDADDSTSSDSRSGEVEEEIKLDDIGYDEEDAEDYDEESFRGMAHGNSKIRRIIKKNALQCTLFRGIEAKRRQQPGAKYPRPKSPLLSQESLVEKLKWLTTIEEQKDADGPLKFHSKPPDVILSTGGVPVNGSIPHSASSEDDINAQTAQGFQPPFYQVQHRHAMPPNNKAGYYVRRDGFPPTLHPSLPRQRVAFSGHPQQIIHTLPYSQNRVVAQPPTSQVQWSEQQRSMSSMTVPRNFRDWRVIQRITGNRNSEGSSRSQQVVADYVRCPNGSISAYPVTVPPDVSRTSQIPSNKDELEQFVEKESKRMDTIRKRYSVAEEDDDPTFGFARRPSVRGVQNRIQSNPSENTQGHGTNKIDPYIMFEEQLAQGPALVHPRTYSSDQMRVWNRDPNWRPDNMAQSQIYGPSTQGGRSQVPMHIHRASVALTELPGNATIPYTHRKPQLDTRYHSYAESMYGSTRTLPTKGWLPPDPRTCHVPNTAAAHQTLPLPNIPMTAVSPPMLQVPPHSVTTTDERGVPEGASSSPKISSDSLYHAPVPDAIATGGPHKEDGMIYYSLNV